MTEQIGKRFEELARRSFESGQYIFTDFLNQAELDIFLSMGSELSYAGAKLWGGYEGSERKMVRFGSEELLGYACEYPIACLLAEPLSEKFAAEYTHRDYLGALMGLGMERRMFGDICVSGKSAYIFVAEQAADYVIENLTGVGRNNITCRRADFPEDFLKKLKRQQTIRCASLRADAVIAGAWNLSRSAAAELFRQEKVTVNGRTVLNNDKMLSVGDVISARGFGKFDIASLGSLSRKGKQNINIELY